MFAGASGRRLGLGRQGLLLAVCGLVIAVGAGLVGSVAAAPAAPRRGEAFTFSLRLGPIEGGRARLSIAPPVLTRGRRQIHVLGQAEAVGIARVLTALRDDYRLVLDADTLSPRTLEIVETGLRQRTVRAELGGPASRVVVTLPDGERRLGGLRYAAARDPVAAFLVMRAARLADGDRLDLVVLDGAALYEGHVEVAGRERLLTEGGERPAIRLRCTGRRVDGNPGGNPRGSAGKPAPLREAMLWLSDDALRAPLRLVGETDLGEARVELTSHEPPQRPLPPPLRLPGVTEHLAAGAPASLE